MKIIDSIHKYESSDVILGYRYKNSMVTQVDLIKLSVIIILKLDYIDFPKKLIMICLLKNFGFLCFE